MATPVLESVAPQTHEQLRRVLVEHLADIRRVAGTDSHVRARVIRSSTPDSQMPEEAANDQAPASPAGTQALRWFVDYITLAQTHPQPVNWVGDGEIIRLSNDGLVARSRPGWVNVPGDHDTSVQLRSDGRTVVFSGNVSRFGHRDNLWGLDFTAFLAAVNGVLAEHGLPPFTGEARVRRFDMAMNVSVGGPERVAPFLVWLATQSADKLRSSTHGQGETINWGHRRQTGAVWKAYDKHAQMQASDQCPRAAAHARAQGIVRFEGSVYSKVLGRLKATQLKEYLNGKALLELNAEFEMRAAVLFRASALVDDLAELPKRLRLAARDHLAGMDLQARMAPSTYHALRKDLTRLGIDISQPHPTPGVYAFRPIEVRLAVPPDWYGAQEDSTVERVEGPASAGPQRVRKGGR